MMINRIVNASTTNAHYSAYNLAYMHTISVH